MVPAKEPSGDLGWCGLIAQMINESQHRTIHYRKSKYPYLFG
jgi:hypothetical protein